MENARLEESVLTQDSTENKKEKGEYERLQELIKEAEGKALKGLYRNGYHIMPPTGWLNDPNGLCQFGEEYHLFFQYSPLDARGGMKAWGHYVTKDFVHLRYEGAPFVPDAEFDRNGVYSGSAYVDEAGMHIFYTGNVKLSGDYDYINSGRRADTVLVESADGKHFGEKQVVIDTDEYPAGYSCHIRDPKVWLEGDTYYMVLGARTVDSVGQILLYRSLDMRKWELNRVVVSEKPFGYMWECPDIFSLDGSYIVSFSPQGLEAEQYRYQNTYQSGYVLLLDNPICGTAAGKQVTINQDEFVEWDMGFDFYAPQTFVDNSGRRILVGWAGVPDPGYDNGEVESENWQHCFTVPRELKLGIGVDGAKKVFQTPISELNKLRTGEVIVIDDTFFKKASGQGAENHVEKAANVREYVSEYDELDVLCDGVEGHFSVSLGDGVTFMYDGGELSLSLTPECGYGRTVRRARIAAVNSLRILVDSSIAEFYVNGGEMVFTTRYYKQKAGTRICFDMPGADVSVYPMQAMSVD